MEQFVSEDIGGRLKRARERRGLSLADAARLTKFSVNVLQAIERNDFASLPGGMFRKAYVRTLATEFGLNPDEIAADYCARCEPAIELPNGADRNADLERKFVEQLTPSPRRSIVTLAALAAAAAVWFMLRAGPPRPQVPVLVARSEPVALPNAMSTLRSAIPAAIAAQATEVSLQIELVAIGWCWVSAETDGERVVYRLVTPGERVLLEGHMISLRLGDAGAVTVSINDGPSRSFGGDGEVVALEVTPDTVEDLLKAAA